MKHKSIFEESRPEMFRLFLREAMGELTDSLRRSNAITRTVKWTGGATRKRVRSLARAQARHAMKQFRAEQKAKAA